MRLVLDASVTIALVADDEHSAYAIAVLAAVSPGEGLVPILWRFEIANTLLTLERQGRVDDASATLETTREHFRVSVIATSPVREMQLAKKHHLTVYDAAYLALAIDERASLATLDSRLARAAQIEGVYFVPNPS